MTARSTAATAAFFDTNVLLHLLSADTAKADRAEELLANGGTISVQVLNELVTLARGQLRMEWDAIDGAAQRQYLAMTYMLVGRKPDAIATLRELLAVPSAVTAPLLRLDPTYRSLRGEPAFQQLVSAGR